MWWWGYENQQRNYVILQTSSKGALDPGLSAVKQKISTICGIKKSYSF